MELNDARMAREMQAQEEAEMRRRYNGHEDNGASFFEGFLNFSGHAFIPRHRFFRDRNAEERRFEQEEEHRPPPVSTRRDRGSLTEEEILAHYIRQEERDHLDRRTHAHIERNRRFFPPGSRHRHIHGYQIHRMGQPDVDNMSYEELLALGERIGNVKSKGATKKLINSIPSDVVEETDTELCSICLDDFQAGQTSKTLSCTHKYHSLCIDKWLANNKHCPICHESIDKDDN